MIRDSVRSGIVCGLALALATGTLAAQETSSPAPPQGSTMVYVNTSAILPQVPGAQEAQEAFNREIEQYTQEVQRLQATVDSMMQAYQQQAEMLSSDARERRQQEIIQKQQELQQRAFELEQQAGERQQELLRPILDRVGNVIEEIRAERGYTIVFDIAAAGVVAANPEYDITAAVLERLGAAAPGSNVDPDQ